MLGGILGIVAKIAKKPVNMITFRIMKKKRKTRRVKKQKYRIRNWKEYNAALVKRGSLTLWFDEEAIAEWSKVEPSDKRGRPLKYSEIAIECMATLKEVYHLPLRATEGLMVSIIELLAINISAPDYSTLSRRKKGLEIVLPSQAKDKAIHLVVDSTGLKVYGEGEWKVRQHGWSKRRTWRKLHIGVDEESGEIKAVVATDRDTVDKKVLPDILNQVSESIAQVSADGAYDYVDAYQEIDKYNARATIPPRRNGRINKRDRRFATRNENIRQIRKVGRANWKKQSQYHRRSLAETAVFRIKTIFGNNLSGRCFETQAVEMFIRCAALNKMTRLGMPDSYVA